MSSSTLRIELPSTDTFKKIRNSFKDIFINEEDERLDGITTRYLVKDFMKAVSGNTETVTYQSIAEREKEWVTDMVIDLTGVHLSDFTDIQYERLQEYLVDKYGVCVE